MSGFEFYLTCQSCGLASGTYPYRFDRVVQPESLELPAADRVRQTFEQVSISIEGRLETREIAELAAKHSTDTVTVYVPTTSYEHEIKLDPSPACPRCGSASIRARFGYRRRPR